MRWSNVIDWTSEQHDDSLNEKCGVFGVYAKGFEAARLVYHGLWALQHRGQESSGIAATDGENIKCYKNSGLVAQVYNEEDLRAIPGFIAVGHNRYSTSGGTVSEHNQPVIDWDGKLALAHNGNLPSVRKLVSFLQAQRVDIGQSNDSELIAKAITFYLTKGLSLSEAVIKSYPLLTGSFSILVMTRNELIAFRDQNGIRPLAIGRLDDGCFAFSSETCALDTINAAFVREVKPGEMVRIDKKGLHSQQIVAGEQKLDIFEFVYFSRPDSILLGKRVNEVRRNLGVQLAKETNFSADVVVPVPDSAIPQALGYSEATGMPFDHGLIKNRYIHRTFIKPDQHLRKWGVQMKLNPLPEVLSGKRVVLIDDSIVRGTTLGQIIKIIRGAGAKEVHVGIASPPVAFPDFYGIDTPCQDELIASRMSSQEICDYIGADSLHFLSYDGLIKATGLPEKVFCTSLFTGKYPIGIGERAQEISYPVKKTKTVKASLFNV